VSYPELWSRTVAVLTVGSVALALAEFDPLHVVISLASCYVVTLLALIGIETCETEEPDVDWAAVRWRAGACSCLFVGFPAACAMIFS
jgi:hypothetical protein